MPKKILIIDDDPVIVKYLKAVFSDNGYASCEAGSSMEGLDRVRQEKPDLITLDIQMPGLDGLGFLTQLRQGERTQNVPIIMVSGLDDDEHFMRGLQEGAYDYITKPVNLDTLLSRLRAHLNDPTRSRPALDTETA